MTIQNMVIGPLAGQSMSSLSVSDDDVKKVSAVIALKHRVKSDNSSQASNKSGRSDKKDTEYSELVDARDEDSFTLDTFDKLIRKARKANKTFLLARVMTHDSQDAGGVLFHYPAHHSTSFSELNQKPVSYTG